MSVLVGLGGAVEVFAPAPAPPVTGEAGGAIGMALLFPLPPLVVGVIALHLVGSGGSAPEESAREMEGGVDHGFSVGGYQLAVISSQ